MVIILLGPPGVGKGTQGVLLSDALGWERLVTGDLLRASRRDGTELGERAREYMDRGDLVPDEIIIGLVGQRLRALEPGQDVLFDGFPRTLPQAEALESALPAVGRKVDGVVLFEAPDDILVKRIGGRRSCPECGRVYNVHFDAPASADVCDDCGGGLLHRSDDQPETVLHRLTVYREQTRPLVRHYEQEGVPLFRIDADRSPFEVQEALRVELTARLGVEG